MLKEITGDLLTVKKGVICHQVNYHGVMGGGIAAAIAENILTEEQYAEYADYCRRLGRAALGTVQFLGLDTDLIVANMFCQDDARVAMGEANITDYDTMRRCFIRVRSIAQVYGKRIYIPRNIGCGIAGGSWDVVREIIKDTLAMWPLEAYIVGRKG